MAGAHEGAAEAGVVDVAAGAAQQVAVEDQDLASAADGILPRSMAPRQKYSLRARSDREVIREVEPGTTYVDRESGEEFQVVGRAAAAGPLPQRAALLGREPAPVRLLARAARPEGPERLPALRPPPAGRRASDGRVTCGPCPRVWSLALPCCSLRWRRRLRGRRRAPRPHPSPPSSRCPAPSPRPTPTETTQATRPAPDPATAPAPRGEGDGSAPAPTSRARPDSPQNDTPPPPGSPAERFEQECERNPEACG